MRNIYISNLLEIIADKNKHWGHPTFWTHRNYKDLSKTVFKASGILISEQTLKRLYGKVKTVDHYSPHIDTLKALAVYCGHKSWDDFVNETTLNSMPVNSPSLLSKETKIKTSRDIFLLKWVAIIVLFLLSFYLFINKVFFTETPHVDIRNFTFEGVVTEGFVPYTVIFKYDISRIKDSVFFQAGSQPKEMISKERKSFSNTFLTPNFYRGKVIIRNSPVKTIPLHNKSKHWVIGFNYTLKTSGRRVAYKPYFEHLEIKNSEGILYYPLDSLLKLEPDIDIEDLWSDIRYFNRFDVDLDDCIIEVRFKCQTRFSFITGAEHGIVLSGEYEDLQLHFVQKGFESKVVLNVSDNELNGRYNDLALFALEDIYSWNNYRVEIINQKAHIYINDVLSYEFPYSVRMGNLKGFRMSFKGVGAIDFFRVRKSNRNVVYEEEFN